MWLSRFPDTKASVHLTDFPTPPEYWNYEELESKWNFIREVRKVVSGAIELSRQKKLIGASLESHPKVFIDSKERLSFLGETDLSEICITSDLSLALGKGPRHSFFLKDVPDVNVVCEPAIGEKCLRCWKILPEVRESLERKVCKRCENVLNN